MILRVFFKLSLSQGLKHGLLGAYLYRALTKKQDNNRIPHICSESELHRILTVKLM